MVRTFLVMFVFFTKEMVFIDLFTLAVFVAPAVVTPPLPQERRKVPTHLGSYLTYTDISAKVRYHIIIFLNPPNKIIKCKKKNGIVSELDARTETKNITATVQSFC